MFWNIQISTYFLSQTFYTFLRTLQLKIPCNWLILTTLIIVHKTICITWLTINNQLDGKSGFDMERFFPFWINLTSSPHNGFHPQWNTYVKKFKIHPPFNHRGTIQIALNYDMQLLLYSSTYQLIRYTSHHFVKN